MTAARRHKPAGATRELLQAIHDYLDLPFVADWDEEPTRDSELLERAARLVGRLETMLDSGTIEDAADTVRGWLGKPLPYEPETPAQTAERHARLARTLREMREPPGQPERPNGRAPGNS
jgi:hypothetical protein